MIKPLKAKAFSSPIGKRTETLLAQARGLVGNDKLLEACDIYNSVLDVDSKCLEALHILGSLELHFKHYAAALDLLNRAVSLQPQNLQLQLLLGKCAKQLKNYDFAEKCFSQALAIDATLVEALVELGMLHFLRGELDLSSEYLTKALELNSKYYDAWNNLGIVNKEKGNFSQSLHCYCQAVAVDPNSPDAFANRGVLFHMLGRYQDALLDLNRAVELSPQTPASHVSRGQLLLTLGEFSQGWSEFEWRWHYLRDNQINTSRYHDFPLWSGTESLIGKTILIYAEQGLGDTLQFCRYVNLVAQLGARVMLECEAPLFELFRSIEGVEHLFIQGGEQSKVYSTPIFDFQCPLMSLPMVFRTTLDTIPNNVPYLKASTRKIEDWRIRLGQKKRPRVGIVWSGGFRPGQPELWTVNRRRNISLSSLKSFAGVPVDFISLQKGVQAEAELTALVAANWGGPPITDYTQYLNDFSDTAALIANLDLVISVDTSTAHLSAALGKPTWILNRFDTCWRWLLNRSDSPWYPSVKLYRQPELGRWEGVIEEVRANLLQIYCN